MIKNQSEYPKSIPVLIISYNQLFYLKQLVQFLQNNGCNNIVIIDNYSSYQPLLDYLKEIESEVKVYRLTENYGHNVFSLRQDLFKEYQKGYYVITDPDIVPDTCCPDDFMTVFKKLLDSEFRVKKVGFSLNSKDIPENNPQKPFIIERQKKYNELADKDKLGNYYADIDTTFAMYRPKIYNFLPVPLFSGIRTKSPYIAKHGGWYMDPMNLTEEQLNYLRSSNISGSWKLDKNGELVNKKFE